jgi:hypothetical protein
LNQAIDLPGINLLQAKVQAKGSQTGRKAGSFFFQVNLSSSIHM